MKSLVNNLMDDLQNQIENFTVNDKSEEDHLKIIDLIVLIYNKLNNKPLPDEVFPHSAKYYIEVLNYWIHYFNLKIKHINNEFNTNFKPHAIVL